MADSKYSIAKWMLPFLFTYAVFDVIFVGLVGLTLGLSMQKLLEPFALIFGCGVIASTLVYWTRGSCRQPASFALGLALSLFIYMGLFMSVLLFSAARNGFISRTSFLSDFISIVIPGSIVSAVVVYVSVRIRLKGSSRNWSG
jgi:tetrahydromethanopterin S-methyltransferase subunit C